MGYSRLNIKAQHSRHLLSRTKPSICLLRLLDARLSRLTIQPDSYKPDPAKNSDPDATNPNPCTANLPAPWPLVVGEVADSDLSLLIDIGQERTTVVDAEVEDSVLIRGLERDAENGCVGGLGYWGKVQSVER